MFLNEFPIQKLERFARAFKEISLFYTTTNRSEREIDLSILPDTSSISGPSSPSIRILLCKFTGHCSSEFSSSLANCRDSYIWYVVGKPKKKDHIKRRS